MNEYFLGLNTKDILIHRRQFITLKDIPNTINILYTKDIPQN